MYDTWTPPQVTNVTNLNADWASESVEAPYMVVLDKQVWKSLM